MFWHPAFGQLVQNKALQFNVPLKDRGALAAKHVASIGKGQAVGSFLVSITTKFATDGGFTPSGGPANRGVAQGLGFRWTPALTLNGRSRTYRKPLILHVRMCDLIPEERVNTGPQLRVFGEDDEALFGGQWCSNQWRRSEGNGRVRNWSIAPANLSSIGSSARAWPAIAAIRSPKLDARINPQLAEPALP